MDGYGGATLADKMNEAMIRAGMEYEEQLDNEMERLDNLKEDDIEDIRRKRMEAMKKGQKTRNEMLMKGHGKVTEIFNEKEFFEAAKESKMMICHFYRESTWRCKIIDKHLTDLAPNHIETRFVKLNIEKSPYLAEKLRILMLPTLTMIKAGKVVYSMIGFDDVGGVDDFETSLLEELLTAWQVLAEK